MGSLWEKDVKPLHFEALDGNRTTDVLIIGGGIAGLMCAYKLKNAGVDCILVEASRICGGITKCTTAKITLAHGLIYSKLVKHIGKERAGLYLQAQLNACKEYERLCRDIDCEYEVRPSYVYSLHSRKKIEEEIAALNALGAPAAFSKASELPIEVAGAVCVSNQAQLHPLKLLYSLARELPVYENTKVLELKPGKAVIKGGSISCKKIIAATHFPLLNKHGAYFLKLYQHRSYVIALKGAQKINGMYVDESDKGLSFRGSGELLLLGGGGHRTGKSGGCWQELEAFAKKHYPKAEIAAKWATQDCMTLDRVPYVGGYSRATPNLFTATGFNKWGMTNAMVSANILCDLVQGKPNPYASVFSPSRSVLKPQLAINAFEAVRGLVTVSLPRCPHMGCALKYNSAEHSWDCSCHGSRFTDKGELIDNPATDDLSR